MKSQTDHDAMREMWNYGALAHVEGCLGFVFYENVLFIRILAAHKANDETSDAYSQVARAVNAPARKTRSERYRETLAKNAKPRKRGECTRCSGLGHKRTTCVYAGVPRP